MGGGDCYICCEPDGTPCKPCDINNICGQGGKKKESSNDGPCRIINPPLGPGPDTILIPIFIDERNYSSSSKKRHSKENSEEEDSKKKNNSPKKKRPRAKSRELRGGVLYMGCDCEKRNGLQDDCRRTGCQGSPECMHIPPSCGPSAYSSGKHLVRMSERWKAKHNVY